ncbi:hypothetical protein ACFWC9_29470 [Streptomyces goshikiensis]|uniref:hypothetical protein n=1 Tax=Streptomyces goshikiensis TaxID=1942 RepID=UPI00369E0CA4
MPYLIPPRTPLTLEEVDRAFDYLLALQMGGENYASGRTPATPELAFPLLQLAENIVFPVTGVLGDGKPHADSFALDEVGCILLSALRDWTRDSPTTGRAGQRPQHHPLRRWGTARRRVRRRPTGAAAGRSRTRLEGGRSGAGERAPARCASSARCPPPRTATA